MILLIKRSSAVSIWIHLNFVIKKKKNYWPLIYQWIWIMSVFWRQVCLYSMEYFYEFIILRWFVASTRRWSKLLIKQIELDRPFVIRLPKRLIEKICDFFFFFSLLIFEAADKLFFWRWITVCWWISHFPYLFLINQKICWSFNLCLLSWLKREIFWGRLLDFCWLNLWGNFGSRAKMSSFRLVTRKI